MNNAKMIYGKILNIKNNGSASVEASEARTLSIHNKYLIFFIKIFIVQIEVLKFKANFLIS